MKRMFSAGGRVKTKLVFLSSCCSERSGDAFVEAGVPHVVAVRKGQSVTGALSAVAAVAVDAVAAVVLLPPFVFASVVVVLSWSLLLLVE